MPPFLSWGRVHAAASALDSPAKLGRKLGKIPDRKAAMEAGGRAGPDTRHESRRACLVPSLDSTVDLA